MRSRTRLAKRDDLERLCKRQIRFAVVSRRLVRYCLPLRKVQIRSALQSLPDDPSTGENADTFRCAMFPVTKKCLVRKACARVETSMLRSRLAAAASGFLARFLLAATAPKNRKGTSENRRPPLFIRREVRRSGVAKGQTPVTRPLATGSRAIPRFPRCRWRRSSASRYLCRRRSSPRGAGARAVSPASPCPPSPSR